MSATAESLRPDWPPHVNLRVQGRETRTAQAGDVSSNRRRDERSVIASKHTLRRTMRARRRALPRHRRRTASHQLAYHLTRSAVFAHSREIACYLAVGGEMDLMPFMRIAWRHGKHVYLPCVDAQGHMTFRRYDGPQTPMRNNRFGIAEPMSGRRRRARELDLVLAPLVAFDPYGNRLGMGGGFYDRTFAFLGRRPRWQRPRLIGVGYRFQRVPQLPAEPWDVVLWAYATERGLTRCAGERLCLDKNKER